MDYGLIAGAAAFILTIVNLWKGSQEYNKAQREAGAKEERDRNRDNEIKLLWGKITEMDTVKQELLKVSIKLETLEGSIEKLIMSLDRHIERGEK